MHLAALVERGISRTEIERMSLEELSFWTAAFHDLDLERDKRSKEQTRWQKHR